MLLLYIFVLCKVTSLFANQFSLVVLCDLLKINFNLLVSAEKVGGNI